MRACKEKLQSKKGFTLVEIIVVLVILAILAALLVPSMTGWIDKAKERKVVANATIAFQAAETIALEKYGIGFVDANGVRHYGIFYDTPGQYASNTAVFSSKGGIISNNISSAKEMAELAGISEDYVCWVHFAPGGKGVINAIMYAQDGYVAASSVGGSWQTVEDPNNSIKQTSTYVYFWDTYKKLFN